MSQSALAYQSSSPITRRVIRLSATPHTADNNTSPSALEQTLPINVLVVNSSLEMAKEITLQLGLELPGCSLVYAPSIEIARWILPRRSFDLVISDAVLTDGGVGKLAATLERLNPRPDLVVVGKVHRDTAAQLEGIQYRCSRTRAIAESNCLNRQAAPAQVLPRIIRSSVEREQSLNRTLGQVNYQPKVSELGADIRNDLNNPLQEIVAMVFVAQQAGADVAPPSPATLHALQVIENTARNMAKVVNGIEEKIRGALT